SFWFRARQRLIEHVVSKYLPGDPSLFLEVGCGTGFVLKGLSRLARLRLTGAELNITGLAWARKRLANVELIQLDVTRIPFQNVYDGMGAFDVIEHIDNDVLALE